MSILLLIPLAAFLVHLPVRTAALFEKAMHWQTKQIAVDNAAIRLGRSDRALFQKLLQVEKALAKMEVAHHAAHLCAKAGQPQCLATDKGLETAIKSLHLSTENMAKRLWHLAEAAAKTELSRLSVSLCRFERPNKVPIQRRRCSRCGLAVGWVIRAPANRVAACHGDWILGATVTWRRRKGEWQYSVSPA